MNLSRARSFTALLFCLTFVWQCKTEAGSDLKTSSETRKFDVALVSTESEQTFSLKMRINENLRESDSQLEVVWKIVDLPESAPSSCESILKSENANHIKVKFKDGEKIAKVSLEVDKDKFDYCDMSVDAGDSKLPPACHKRDGIQGGNRIDSCLISEKGGVNTIIGTVISNPMPVSFYYDQEGWKSSFPEQNFARAGELTEVDDIVSYGKLCAAALGPIPPFSCLDGEVIKIFKDGVENKNSPSRCDNPAYLGLSGGECNSFARLGRVEMSNPNVDAVFICRRYKKAKDVMDPYFQDVAIVQHHRITGETCWFQGLAGNQPGGRNLNGLRVPPPTEESLPSNWVVPRKFKAIAAKYPNMRLMDARTLWMSPSSVASITCVRCHDSDPFMYSPHIRDLKLKSGPYAGKSVLPCDPGKKGSLENSQCDASYYGGQYISIGKFFKNWPKSYSIAPKKNKKCVSCHRIGSLSTRSTWAPDSVGEILTKTSFRTAKSKSFPYNHWMPPKHRKRSKASWNSTYKKSWNSLKFCLDSWSNYSDSESQPARFKNSCVSEPITSNSIVGNFEKVSFQIMDPVEIPDRVRGRAPTRAKVKFRSNYRRRAGSFVMGISVYIDIAHEHVGNLKIWLVHGNRRALLFDPEKSVGPPELLANPYAESIKYEFTTSNTAGLSIFNRVSFGRDAWVLEVSDTTAYDTGTIRTREVNGPGTSMILKVVKP